MQPIALVCVTFSECDLIYNLAWCAVSHSFLPLSWLARSLSSLEAPIQEEMLLRRRALR